MAYLNKDQESDAPWLAAGFLTAGILLVSAPACLSPKWPGTPLLKTGCSLISVGFEVTSLLLYRRIRYYLYPQWLRNRDYEAALQEDLAAISLKNELSKAAAILVTQTRAELEQQFPNGQTRTLEPGDDTTKPQPPQTTNDCQREVERLWSELTTDQQRKVLKNLEKSLDGLPDKGSSDFSRDGRPGGGRPDQLAENEADGQLDGQPTVDDLERVRVLVQMAGLKLPDALKKVTGKDSGHRQYKQLRKAYLDRYPQD